MSDCTGEAGNIPGSAEFGATGVGVTAITQRLECLANFQQPRVAGFAGRHILFGGNFTLQHIVFPLMQYPEFLFPGQIPLVEDL